jgi:plastocyanin
VAEDDNKLTVPVAFGRGLNTAQPGNVVNHVIIPNTIKTKQGGVVHFLVAGFHQVFVYNDGTQVGDIAVPMAGTFINDLSDLLYQGINPAGGPLMTPGTTNPSNAMNRVESISFAQPGTYLVICNVRAHFNDGMFAFVRVE